jgi:hypothetical protein
MGPLWSHEKPTRVCSERQPQAGRSVYRPCDVNTRCSRGDRTPWAEVSSAGAVRYHRLQQSMCGFMTVLGKTKANLSMGWCGLCLAM